MAIQMFFILSLLVNGKLEMQYNHKVQAMHKNEYLISNEYLIMVNGSTNHQGIIVLKPLSYY